MLDGVNGGEVVAAVGLTFNLIFGHLSQIDENE